MQYFYDKDDSSLTFTDIQCPSARRCIASGILDEGKHIRGVVVVTADGGANWTIEEVKERPISLYFGSELNGWMVTDHGIWSTAETGRTWKKIKDLKDLERVYFLDDNHGFAVGSPKLVLETKDAGRSWAPVAEADKAPTAPDGTIFHWIEFTGGAQGLIAGAWALPRNPRDLPDWMVPESARYRRQFPTVAILLQTMDAGKNWILRTRNMDGALTRFKYGSRDWGLALFEYPNSAAKATEVMRMDLVKQQNEPVYQSSGRSVRDFVILPGGDTILAAIEQPGKSNQLPIPGKLKMMLSSSLDTWIDMDIDYRAVASRVTLAASDAHNVWVATDTGMILKLSE